MNTNKTYHCTKNGMFCYTIGKNKKRFIPFDNKQTEKTTYNISSDIILSQRQRKIYRECLYGLKSLDQKELDNLSFEEKIKIHDKHKKTQKLLNLSKWKIAAQIVSAAIKKNFKDNIPKSLKPFLNTDVEENDNYNINYLPLNSLGKTENIINKLIENNIIEKDFYRK